MDIETYPTGLAGYRLWIYDEGKLRSWVRPYFWPQTSRHVSECQMHGHAHPQADCHCGLYAHHHLEMTLACAAGVAIEKPGKRVVIGAVIGAGHVEVHRLGWRAEKLQILGLWAPEEDLSSTDLHKLADLYQTHAYPDLRTLRSQTEKKAAPIASRLLPEPQTTIKLPFVTDDIQRKFDRFMALAGFSGAMLALNLSIMLVALTALLVASAPGSMIVFSLLVLAMLMILLTGSALTVDQLRTAVLDEPPPDAWRRIFYWLLLRRVKKYRIGR